MIDIVTSIFRPILRDLQPNLRTPVYHHKVSLMMQEIVFMCVVSISIDWLFCNLSISVLRDPQFPFSVLCKSPTSCFRTLSGFGARALLDHLSVRSHRSELHAESFQGGRRESRRNFIIEIPEGTSVLLRNEWSSL
jgi:hypothetical protein